MGGIAGMIRFDGQEVSPADSATIINLLTHRGVVESQPINPGVLMAFGSAIEVSRTAPVYATVDADIFSDAIPDHPFVTNFIQRGPASVNDLNADFAVAIWDSQQQTLFCMRDALGVKPLYYVYQPGRFFAFASEIKALLALSEVSQKPNKHKFREYLTWATDYVPYSSETFYETIYSLLPGHYLQVNAEGIQLQAYWQPDLNRFSGLPPAEYSSLFHDYFTTAIDRRINGKKTIGAHLSGGLDSSSVSSVAQSLLTRQHRSPLHTFAIDTEQPAADEQEYIQSVIDQWPVQHHTVHPVADVLDSVLKINHIFDRPEHFIIPSSFHLGVSLEARQLGCDILLTGHDGDGVIPTGIDFLDELLDASNWAELQLACQQLVSFPDRNLAYITSDWSQLSEQAKYEKLVLATIGPNLKKRIRDCSGTAFLTMLRDQKRIFRLSSNAIIAYIAQRVQNKLRHQALITSALSAEFIQQVPQRREQTTNELVTTLSAEHRAPINQILQTTNVICNEQMNHIGAYYGHQYSFPFFDKNVLELGLATPLKVHFDNGRGRGLIRNGLRDTLPPAIVTRLTKASFVEYGTLSAQQLYQATRELFSPPDHPVWEVIDRVIFAKLVAIVFDPRFPARKKTRYNWLVSRIIYLALWLSSLK